MSTLRPQSLRHGLKKVFQLVDAARRMHIFPGCCTRDRGFVQINFPCDVRQDQGAHRLIAMIEEGALVLDNRGSDF